MRRLVYRLMSLPYVAWINVLHAQELIHAGEEYDSDVQTIRCAILRAHTTELRAALWDAITAKYVEIGVVEAPPPNPFLAGPG